MPEGVLLCRVYGGDHSCWDPNGADAPADPPAQAPHPHRRQSSPSSGVKLPSYNETHLNHVNVIQIIPIVLPVIGQRHVA